MPTSLFPRPGDAPAGPPLAVTVYGLVSRGRGAERAYPGRPCERRWPGFSQVSPSSSL